MTENNNERRTFKWGDQEYLLDDLLREHGARELEFYDFARNRGSYDATALAGLRNAIANRINAAKSGRAFLGDGALDDDVADNTSIQTLKKGLFKKEKYVDQDNTVWAKHYMNKLMSLLKPYEGGKKASKGDWDISKHGLEAYLTGQGLNAKDVFEKYDLKDENNPENPRSFTGRHTLLRNQLQGYKTWLQGKGFDFTKNDNEWDDDFMTSLDTLINNQDWSDSAALSANLRKLGAGDYYTTAFTSDRWDLSKTNEQTSEEAKKAAEEKKAKEEKEAYAKHMKGTYDTYSALSDNNLGGTYFTSDGDGLFEMSDSEYEKWLNKHTDDSDAYMKTLQESYYKNPFDAKIAGEYLPLAGRFGAIKDVTIDGKVWSYDPRTIDRKNNRVVVFDKETGEMKHTFLGDVEEELKRMKREWRLKNGYEEASEKYTKYDELGGVLTMQTGGGFNLAQAVNRDLAEKNKVKAEKTGNSEEVLKARDRVVSNGDDSFVSEKKTLTNPDAGLSGAEVARLISIGADISSLFLDPVTGTAVGLGSTAANFIADITDDGFQFEDVKNLGINVGFDLLGAIPLFGDALGTGTKITRQLVKWAPRAMGILAGYQGVKNFDGMMESWGKFVSGDKDLKLTVQDWRNIAQSIGLITGGTRAIKNKAAQSKMKRQARLDDVVGVNVRDKNGNILQILVDGDVAKNIRAALGDKAKIEAELSKMEDFKDKFGENGTWEVNTKSNGDFQFNPFTRHKNADGSKSSVEWEGFRKEGRADVNDVYDFSRVPAGYGASRGFKIPKLSNWLNKQHLKYIVGRFNNGPQVVSNNVQTNIDARGKMTNEAIDAQQTKLLTDQNILAQIDKLRASSQRRKEIIDRLDTKITNTQSSLDAAKANLRNMTSETDPTLAKAQAEATMQGLPDNNTIIAAQNSVASSQAAITRAKKARKDLKALRALQLADAEAGIKGRVSKKELEIKDLKSKVTSAKSRLAAAKAKDAKKGIVRSHPKLEQNVAAAEAALAAARKNLKTTKKNNPKDLAEAISRIQSNFNRAYRGINLDIKTAKGLKATAQPIADQRKAMSLAYALLKAASEVIDLQKSLNTFLGRRATHNQPTSHTLAYKDLETMLANLRQSNSNIGGRTINWDMDAILQKYGVDPTTVYKLGGPINRTKINKFLNYGKG